MNPWHDLHFGKKAPEIVTAIIEIPSGSIAKYELDKESGLLMLDRVMSGAVFYPGNYGLIPKTYCGDKDPLDILVLSKASIYPRCLVDARVIGVMEMIDNNEVDDKIIAVADQDPYYKDVHSLEDLPKIQVAQIKEFFENYKALENKIVDIKEFADAAKAKKIIEEAIELYKVTFGK